MVRLCTGRIGYDQQSMHVEAVQEEALPTREGLVRDFMKIECRHCAAAYHLYHDGLALNVLRDFFLQASWEMSHQHPNHSRLSRVISLDKDSTSVHRRAS
jgi:hypothetical protein